MDIVDLVPSSNMIEKIRKELQTHVDYLSLAVHVINAENLETFAMATINLWIMIEDSCNLPLQARIELTKSRNILLTLTVLFL
jgi:hypothetical protein